MLAGFVQLGATAAVTGAFLAMLLQTACEKPPPAEPPCAEVITRTATNSPRESVDRATQYVLAKHYLDCTKYFANSRVSNEIRNGVTKEIDHISFEAIEPFKDGMISPTVGVVRGTAEVFLESGGRNSRLKQ